MVRQSLSGSAAAGHEFEQSLDNGEIHAAKWPNSDQRFRRQWTRPFGVLLCPICPFWNPGAEVLILDGCLAVWKSTETKGIRRSSESLPAGGDWGGDVGLENMNHHQSRHIEILLPSFPSQSIHLDDL
jgi:hypothetical protein